MIHFVFSDKDPRYIFLKPDNQQDINTLKQLQEYVNLVDPICYLKTYTGPPFTQNFLFEFRRNTDSVVYYASIGMWQVFYKYFKEHNINFDGLDPKKFKYDLKHTFEEFKQIVRSWNLKFEPRDYQYEAAYKILCWKKSISELATRAGKTLIAYIIFRYAHEYLNTKRILAIVPSVSLVKQMASDFAEYGEYFNTECIWSQGKLMESANFTVGTFQSLIKFLDRNSKKYNPDFFNGYDIVFVDETHRATAAQIKEIISQKFMLDVKIAFGMTGTVPKEHTIERYCLHSLLGAKIQEVKPIKLMNAGYISKVKIYQHRLSYKNKEKQFKNWLRCAEYSIADFITQDKLTKTGKIRKVNIPLSNPEFLIAYQKTLSKPLQEAKNNIYLYNKENSDQQWGDLMRKTMTDTTGANASHTEQMVVHFMDERTQYIIGLLKECPKNTLVLAQHREYIKYLHNEISKAFPDRPVLCVIGGAKDNKKYKQVMKDNKNCIVIAGYSLLSTGVTMSDLCFGIFTESFKSEVINMQSIGRGLGLSDMKNEYILHDITDCFDKTLVSNKIYLQGRERIKIYEEQHYPYEIIKKEI